MATVRMAGGEITVGNVFCIGRNYAAHAVELGNAIETEEPMVFLKPTSSVLKVGEPLRLPAWLKVISRLSRVAASIII